MSVTANVSLLLLHNYNSSLAFLSPSYLAVFIEPLAEAAGVIKPQLAAPAFPGIALFLVHVPA